MSPRPSGPGVIRIPASPVARPMGGEEFQVLLQSIYDAVFITEPQGQILGANVRAEQFFAAPRAELCKKNVLDWLCGADRGLLDTISGSLEGNRFVLIQALCRRSDETMFPAEISVVRLPLGGKTHLSFFIRDITLRKESEERLKTGYNALQNAGSGIAVADVEGGLAGYVNPSMLALLGLETVEEAYEHNFRQFLKEEALAADMIAAAQAGDTWSGEMEMKRKDGTPFFAQVGLAPNLNPDGAMTGIVISLVDVTPQRQAQQQLELYAAQLRQKNTEMEADLRMARDLQYAFLPSSYPAVATDQPGKAGRLEFAHVYHPSGLVGGDFFDILPVSTPGADVRGGRDGPRGAGRAGGGDPARAAGADREGDPGARRIHDAAERGLFQDFQQRERADVRDGLLRAVRSGAGADPACERGASAADGDRAGRDGADGAGGGGGAGAGAGVVRGCRSTGRSWRT
jgi:PAS domain S-box-containing protein